MGCGTGQAAFPLAQRGFRIVAVELGPQLAALARKKLAVRRHRGGQLAALDGCHWVAPARPDPFLSAVQEDYQAVGYPGDPPPPTEEIGPWHFPPDAAALFSETLARRYAFTVTLSAEDYIATLATQSGTRLLSPVLGDEFLMRVNHRLTAMGQHEVTLHLVARLACQLRGRSHLLVNPAALR